MSANVSQLKRSSDLRGAVIALVAGAVFAAGLALGGMMDPRKVQGFLNIGGIGSGGWDPSLAFVMGGALVVSFITFIRVKATPAPWVGADFWLPKRDDVDARLVLGAVLFGVGWGIAGFCPGPALANVLQGGAPVLTFVGAMLVGMFVAKKAFA
jgi:uncharacterized protein